MASIAELAVNLVANTASFNKTMKQVSKDVQKIGKEFTSAGKQIATLTAPLALLGAAGIAASLQLDDAFDAIRIGTGATGENLKILEDDFKAVFSAVPVSAEDASKAIADLNTRMGLSGAPLQELSTQMLNLARITGSDVNQVIETATRLFGDWSIPIEKSGDTLDYLFKVSQSTGIGINDLSAKMVQFGAPLRNMGFDFETSSALMGKFEKEGVNLELVMGSLRQAMKKFSDQGIDANDGLKQIMQQIKDAESPTKAAAMAFEIFGARAGGDMADAIRGGRFEIDDLITSLKNSSETINTAAKDTDGFKEKLILLKNNVSLALEPIGAIILDVVAPAIDTLLKGLQSLATWFSNLNPTVQKFITYAGMIAVTLGPVIIVMGTIITKIGVLLPLIAGAGLKIAALTISINPMVLAIGAAVLSISLLITKLIQFAESLNTTKAAMDDFAQQNKAMRQSAQDLADKGIEAVNQRVKNLNTGIEKHTEILKRLKDKNLQNTEQYKKSAEMISKAKSELSLLTPKQKEATKALEESTASTTKNATAQVNLGSALDKTNDKKDTAKKKTSELEKEQKKLADQTSELSALIRGDANVALDDFKAKVQEIINANPEKDIKELADEIAEVGKSALEAGANVGELAGAVEGISSGGDSDFFGALFGTGKETEFSKEMGAGIAQDIGKQLQTTLTGVFDSLLEGGSLRDSIENAGAGIGSTLGGSIGAAFGGPVGAAIGGSFGKILGDKVGSVIANIGKGRDKNLEAAGLLLGGPMGFAAAKAFNHAFGRDSDPAANAREAFKNFLNDAINLANEAGADIQEFIIPGGRDAFDPYINAAGEATTIVGEQFATLDAETQERFLGLGNAFSAIFDNEDLESGQLGQLLAANFGMGANSLNDLQIALVAAGHTAESVGQALETAFLAGDLSAKDYLVSLRETENLFAQGIPDGVGLTGKAFENLANKGLKSGREALDSIGDVGAEAMEKVDAGGNRLINTLNDLRADLINSGHSVEDVDKFMQALASNGIDSIEKLRDVTAQQAAGIISSMQDAGFGFAEVGKEIDRLHDKLNKIKSKEIDVKVNVKYTSSGDKPPTGGEIVVNAKGNIYDGGAVKKFARGGVIDAPTFFPMTNGLGLMGEAGAEAIMPLKRMSGGELGVRADMPSTQTVNITVDARGAEIGAAKRIRQELENYFDTRNNFRGNRT